MAGLDDQMVEPPNGSEIVDVGPDDDPDAFEAEPLAGIHDRGTDGEDFDDDDQVYGDDEDVFVDGTVGRSDIAAERDDYRDALLRVKADFENYKKRVAKEHADRVSRAAEGLVEALLPVLDACQAAVNQGAADVEPVMKSLFDILTKEGLEVIHDEGEPFDPLRHEAVMHEDGDGEQVVAISLRPGYAWKGRVLRPAMVKVRG